MKRSVVLFIATVVWSIGYLSLFIREVWLSTIIIGSRHRFYHKCTEDLSHRQNFLEACTTMTTLPTNYYMDVLLDAIPKVPIFVFFDAKELLNPWVLGKMIALAVCKVVFGDVITAVLNIGVKHIKDRRTGK